MLLAGVGWGRQPSLHGGCDASGLGTDKTDTAYRRFPVLRSKPDVDITKDRLVETWETTRDALGPRISAAREVGAPYAHEGSTRVAPDVAEASTRMAPYVDEARTRLQPAVDRLSPAVDTAKSRIKGDVVPAVIAAAETARETSAPARAEAKERAANALLALRGEQVKKVRRWPVAVVALLAGAAAGAVVGMRRQAPQPTPPVTPPTPFPAAARSNGVGVGDEATVHGASTTSRNPGDD